eukprot:CAMPEP_0198714410 /NCGR_PEP_ID=MMETSP1471-20131121/20543_1 /TAXON_ID=41880 /ORGANISM="Pycnococcus provasolii, Strain RCC733" /LENGTH=91 /DNA_ID=CAMNT_0044474697 /DNA_START=162 /DNA_END=434 /DNA_ORIENTATION=-
MRVGDDDASSRRVLERESRRAVSSCETSDAPRHVFSAQRLDILHFESLDVQVIETEQCECVSDFESKEERRDEVRTFLERGRFWRRFRLFR